MIESREYDAKFKIFLYSKTWSDQISQYEDIDEGVAKCSKILALRKLAKTENVASAEEVQKGKQQRENALENIHRNYQKELDDIMSSIPKAVS